MTHGHELSEEGKCGWEGGAGQWGMKGRKKWNKYISIINKTLKKILYILIKANMLIKNNKSYRNSKRININI